MRLTDVGDLVLDEITHSTDRVLKLVRPDHDDDVGLDECVPHGPWEPAEEGLFLAEEAAEYQSAQTAA